MDKNVFRNLSYGMYVVGARDSENRNVGCISNSICQITSNPSTIIVSLNHNNYTNKAISKTKKFSVSILKEDTDSKVIGTFGYKSSLDIDKFESFDYDIKENLPFLKDNCGVIICEVINTMETETHTVFLANVLSAFNYSLDTPMTYRYYHEVLKGKSPKNAPTYVEEKSDNKTKWRCKVCGYEVDMDELPEDYVCPICGAKSSMFEKVI